MLLACNTTLMRKLRRPPHRFAETVDRVYDEILEAPNRFAADKDGVRRKPVKGFAEHSIEYRVEDETVEIIAIRHHKRKPGFWRRRL